jgi:hypothetical protein
MIIKTTTFTWKHTISTIKDNSSFLYGLLSNSYGVLKCICNKVIYLTKSSLHQSLFNKEKLSKIILYHGVVLDGICL